MSTKVSVMTTTYNHERFIAQAVESVLAQIVDFGVEHVIGEDCSTDRTRDILLRFREQHPERIRLLLRKKNVGRRHNFIETFTACRGEYIAILEGDDYWTSPHKLQRQVDFLDAHPEYTICFHDVDKRYEEGTNKPRGSGRPLTRTRYTIEDLLERNFIPTCSVMFRNGLFPDFPQWFYTTPSGDWPLHVLNAQHGDIGYIDETMAVHRTHSGGVWSPKSNVARQKNVVTILETFKQNLDPRYAAKLEESIAHGHLRVLRALDIERDYRGFGTYAWELLTRRQVSKAALTRAGIEILRSKVGGR